MDSHLLYIGGYLLLGSCAGLLAGLLGVGGGIIIVPTLTMLFTFQGLPAPYISHLAIGTSLATIIFTAISSVKAHHGHGAVDWPVFWRITPGIVIGTGVGTIVAAHLSTTFLRWLFACFITYVALQMLLEIKPKTVRSLPVASGIFLTGSVIGSFSSLVGIGGGSMSVPFLVWCNFPVHRAIATSAAIGLPIALAGGFGYMLNGASVQGLPRFSIGFVYVPALVAISVASMSTAPLGARLAHRLPVKGLKKAFATFLLVIACRLLWGLVKY